MAETTKKTATKVAETPVAEERVPVKLLKDREHQDDVFVAVNGETFHIQRGKEVLVPTYIKKVLDNKERMEEVALDRSLALQEGLHE